MNVEEGRLIDAIELMKSEGMITEDQGKEIKEETREASVNNETAN
ncbi:hypothetical protein [Bacillus sp. FJAT-29790]|nr:hypothetical protein [Bacillus sp. FJAT-29790]